MMGWVFLQVLVVPATAIALASAVAKYTTKKAIDQRFESATQNLRHKHDRPLEDIKGENAREVERLKGEINTSIDRVTKLHHFEYETLPEAWRLLHIALGDVNHVIKRGDTDYNDVASMSRDVLETFTENLPWDQVYKNKLLAASDKKHVYHKYSHRYNLGREKQSHAYFHNYLIEKGIFIQPELRDGLRLFADDMGEVLFEHKTQLEVRGAGSLGFLTSEQIRQLYVKADAFLMERSERIKTLEAMIQVRLWTVRV